MESPPRVSVAVPVFNEEETVLELLQRVGQVLDSLPGGPHEILFVNDGSWDRTPQLLEESAARDPRVVIVSLSRNFGHQVALSAALDHVTGDVAVLMDGDLQDPPEAIPRFLDEYAQGYDVVYAQRTRRKETLWLRSSYFVFYRLLSWMANLNLPLDSGDFALISRRVIDLIRQSPEYHRYLRGLRAWVGFKQKGIAVERSERYAGKSKYSVAKLCRLALDGIFAFTVFPLRAAALLGLASVGLATIYAIYAVFAALFLSRSPAGFTALIVTVTFLSGLNLIFLGIIGEYVGRVYEQVKARPLYVVDHIIRRSSTTDESGETR